MFRRTMASSKWPKGVVWEEGSLSVQEEEWAWNDAEQNLSDLVCCMQTTPDFQTPTSLSFVGNLLRDASADILATLIRECPSSCIDLDLRRCRMTEKGIQIILEAAAATGGRRKFNLEGNPIADPTRVQLDAQRLCRDVVLQLSVPWTSPNGKAALESKQTWRDQMHGPASLLRLELEKCLPSGSTVSCPVCHKLLGKRPRSHDAAASQARAHIMSDGHRKALWELKIPHLSGDSACITVGHAVGDTPAAKLGRGFLAS